jgi:hypothetical protein
MCPTVVLSALREEATLQHLLYHWRVFIRLSAGYYHSKSFSHFPHQLLNLLTLTYVTQALIIQAGGKNPLYKHMQQIVGYRENTVRENNVPPGNTKFIVQCETLMVPELQGHILYFFTFLLGKHMMFW